MDVPGPPPAFLVELQPTAKTIEIKMKIKMRFTVLSSGAGAILLTPVALARSIDAA